METQVKKNISPLMWITGISLTLFSVVGIAAIMGWLPASIGGSIDQVSRAVQTSTTQVATNSPASVVCAECGVIESVREFNSQGTGTGLGAVGGAVVGGVLGHQVGGGRGKDLATVVGAVGGAVAGNEIEKQVKVTKHYEITVRFDDGSSRVFNESRLPTWRVGDRIEVINGTINSGS